VQSIPQRCHGRCTEVLGGFKRNGEPPDVRLWIELRDNQPTDVNKYVSRNK
jgi:hypothetical protein